MKKAVVLIVFLLIGVVSAWKYDTGSSNVYGSYSGNDFVRGTVNMSFTEQVNEKFTSNFSGEIDLMSLFDKMRYERGKNFTCNPASCKEGYNVIGESSENKQLSLVGGEKQKFGFVLSTTSNVETKVKEFKMKINSAGGVSCSNQIYIDLLNDGTIDFYNIAAGSDVCGTKNYGCFREDESSESDRTIGSTPFCEKMELPAAPSYKVGAKITAGDTTGEEDLVMRIYNLTGGNALGFCKISSSRLLKGQTGELDCIVKHSSEKNFKAFVCISKLGSNNHKIKVEFKEPCGLNELPGTGKELTTDYDVFAQAIQYSGLENFAFPENYGLIGTGDVEKMFNKYLGEMYNFDCRNNCVIPFSVWTEKSSQEASIHSIYLRYSATGGDTDTAKIWKTEEKNFTISSGFLNLDIEKMGFVVPNTDGVVGFVLKFGGEKVLNKSISVSEVFDFDVGPKFVLIGQSTLFIAKTSENITSSIWDFGDGAKETHYGKEATHRYMNSSEYWIELTLTNSEGRISKKKFKIIVGEPKVSAEILINKYNSRISNIEGQINNFSLFVKEAIKREIVLEENKNTLNKINQDFKLLGNGSNSEYIKIINRLINIYVPSSVELSLKGNFPGEIGFNNINVGYIEEISDETGGDKELLKRKIVSWIDENYDIVVEFEGFSAEEDMGKKELLNYYKVKVNQKDGAHPDDFFLIIGQPESSIKFKENYEEKSFMEDSAVYIPIGEEDTSKIVEFLIIGENAPSVETLGLYISPVLDELELGGKEICDPNIDSDCEEEGFWRRLLIGLGIVLGIVIIIYILLQEWYKRYYEKRLFENPDELYNLINFVYNSRTKGMRDEEIKKKLVEMKWKNEKIRYGFRKIDGKRTGMWEIPIFKFFENRKVKQEIQKKNPGAVIDNRFIQQRRPMMGVPFRRSP